MQHLTCITGWADGAEASLDHEPSGLQRLPAFQSVETPSRVYRVRGPVRQLRPSLSSNTEGIRRLVAESMRELGLEPIVSRPLSLRGKRTA